MDNQGKKAPLSELMETTITKIREMVDSNTIIGEPISTPDSITNIPISRVSIGFGTGGGDYGNTVDRFGGAGAASVKIDPVSFLIVQDGMARVIPAGQPLSPNMDLVMGVVDKIGGFFTRKKEENAEQEMFETR